MDERVRTRVTREEWAKRVERWRESGLSASEFAGELGINARTLTYWKWVLDKEARGEKRTWPSRNRGGRRAEGVTAPKPVPALSELVEVHAAPRDARFELELGAGRRLRVPSSFDATELRRLLDVLEGP